jgi:hypothetical protein
VDLERDALLSGAASIIGDGDLDDDDAGEGDAEGDVAALTAAFMDMDDDSETREETNFDDSTVSSPPAPAS